MQANATKCTERKQWRYIKSGSADTLKRSVYITKEKDAKLETLRKKLNLRSINEVVNFLMDKYLDLYLAEDKEKKPTVVVETRRYT